MSIRVDLMREGEFRRQGAVSTAFVIRATIGSVLGFSLLFGFLAFLRARTAEKDLLASKEIWAMREPYYDKIQAMKKDLAKEKILIEELEGWKRGRVAWNEHLFALQKVVPAAMQLRRLTVRGDLEFERPPVATKSVAGGDEHDSEKKAAEPSIGTPVRQYTITLEGRASGRQAEDLVVQFVRVLDQTPSYRGFLESVKLQSLQRDTMGGANLNDRRFVVEAMTTKMRVK